jgi:hypothetical protein
VADQPVSRTVADAIKTPLGADEPEAHHGRPASWVTTATVIAGFVIGGIALPIGPTWWLFWTGAGLVVLGAIIGTAVHIFDDWY